MPRRTLALFPNCTGERQSSTLRNRGAMARTFPSSVAEADPACQAVDQMNLLTVEVTGIHANAGTFCIGNTVTNSDAHFPVQPDRRTNAATARRIRKHPARKSPRRSNRLRSVCNQSEPILRRPRTGSPIAPARLPLPDRGGM